MTENHMILPVREYVPETSYCPFCKEDVIIDDSRVFQTYVEEIMEFDGRRVHHECFAELCKIEDEWIVNSELLNETE